MGENMNTVLLAFTLSFLAGISTMIGSLFIFLKDSKNKLLKNSLSFASGVMVCASLYFLIPESLLLLYKGDKTCSFIIVSFLILLGILFSFVIDKIMPESKKYKKTNLYKLGVFSMIAIILHNIPEGITTFLSTNTNIKLGIVLTIAIALHNIPEGISISVPVFKATGSKKTALFFTFISGMSEPLGSILVYLFLKPFINNTIMGFLISLTAGIMIYIGFLKLLPTSLKYKNRGETIVFFIIGVLFMGLSKIILE